MGLFLKQMEASRKVLPNLLRSRLSASMVGEQPRLMFAAAAAPDLAPKDIHQIAALPLGSRVIMDPWTGRVEMNKARSAPVVAVREKLPFTLAPFYPYLTRVTAEKEATPQHPASPKDADQALPHSAALDGAK
jgi:hypothetical protein